QDTLLGFGAGIMLAASAFSLVLPGLQEARRQGAGAWSAGLIVGAAILAGAALILALDRIVPHEHFVKGPEGGSPQRLKRAWLFVFAVCLHNLPEGLAIGVGYAAGDLSHGTALAAGIAIQDLPEGLVVALALIAVGYGRAWSLMVGMVSGLIEPVGAVAGASVVTAVPGLLPCGLGFAAGAMLYVVSHEIIPESHRQGHEHWATAGLMSGFVLMMVLDTALG
ncbi:MAG TPA: ZIP family metal transporter, partial [Xanthomonadaceae bacterium]|nr:ZIP family metal transporter [Xanthomonadaceae bacterium]